MHQWRWMLGGLAATLPIAAAMGQPDIPLHARVILAGLWVCALWRPLVGVLAWGGLAPIAVPVLGLAGSTTPMTGDGFTDALSMAVVGGAALRVAHTPQIPTRLGAPALVLGVVIAGAACVDLSLVHLLSPSTGAFVSDLWTHVTTTYFTDQRTLASWHLSAHWLSALTLAVLVERLVRQTPSAGPRAAIAMLGGLTLGAAFSVWRLIEIVGNAEDRTSALVHHLSVTRISPFLPDVNATASLLVLVAAAWVVASLASGAAPRRLAALGGAGLTLLALWLTGSRAAQAALLIGAALGVAWHRRLSTRTVALAGLSLVVVAAVATTQLPTRATQSDAGTSLGVRWDMAQISLQVARTAPAFGVGAGQFREASIPFVSDALIARFPQTRVGENAHNQMLQILGEWGVVGVLAWAWLVLAAAGALRGADRPWWRAAIGGGWAAFLLSAMFGHPWLMGPVILLTVPALGLIAAGGGTSSPRPPWWRRASVLALVVVATVPLRASERRFSTDLDHYVIGASRTAGDQDGVAYRIARASSTWFVRATAQVIEIPLRVDPESATPSCLVTLKVDGTPANRMPVSTEAWTRVRFSLTAGVYRQVNRRIDIQAAPDSCALRVGRFTILD